MRAIAATFDLRSHPLVKRIGVAVLTLIAVIGAGILLQSHQIQLVLECGLGAQFVTGTIVAMPAAVYQESNPHSTVPEYSLGRRPIVEVNGTPPVGLATDIERAPSAHRVGDRVTVCYQADHPDQAHIVSAGN